MSGENKDAPIQTVWIDWMMGDEMRAKVEPHLAYALQFAPAWLQTVSARWDTAESVGGMACISVAPEYRTASLRVADGWFSETEGEQRIVIVHEVIHAHTQTLHAVYKDLAEALNPDEPLKKWAEEQWRRAEEGMICDLSRRLAGV